MNIMYTTCVVITEQRGTWRNLTKLELTQDFVPCGQCMLQRKINRKINVKRLVHDVLFALSFKTKPA